MILGTDEKIIYELAPNKKILVPWFLTKTLTYSLATLMVVTLLLFFVNTADLLSDFHETKETATIIESDSTVEKPEIDHPFTILVDYWYWALLFTFFISVIIQIYFVYLRETYRYVITNNRCVFIGGILRRVERSVSYKKVTDVQRTQNILERALGIWNVQVFTPGTGSVALGQGQAKAEINFDGLVESEEAMAEINKYVHINH